MEPTYGYNAPRHAGPGGGTPTSSAIPSAASAASAAVRLKNTDGALRAEIMGNAQRRYEAAARELWIRTQAEVQAQVKAFAHRQARPRSRGQVYGRAYPIASVREWPPAPAPAPAPVHPMQSRPVVRAHAPVHDPTRRPEYYTTQSPTSRPPTHVPNAPRPSPSTTNPVYYRFRQVPKQPGTEQETNKIYKEEDLKVDELKRRYYAQLSNQKYIQTGYVRDPMRAIGGYAPYSQGSSGTPVRTMADEYLNYYMPARRGPQAGSSYRQAEKRLSEEPRHPQDGGAEQQAQIPVPVITRHNSTPEVRSRGIDDVVHSRPPPRSPVRMDSTAELAGQSQPSKSKLSFLLNPTEPRDRDKDRDAGEDPQSRDRATPQCNCQKQKESGDSNSVESLPSEREQAPRTIWCDSERDGCESEHVHVHAHARHESRAEDRCRYREYATPSSSKRKLEDEDGPLHAHRDTSDSCSPRPACTDAYYSPGSGPKGKRRLSSPLSPNIPKRGKREEEEEEEEDENEHELPPRARRRMLRRLPSQSEDGPEEEERDDAYVMQLSESTTTRTRRIPVSTNAVSPTTSRSWDEPRSRLRHKNSNTDTDTKADSSYFAHSATCEVDNSRSRGGRKSEADFAVAGDDVEMRESLDRRGSRTTRSGSVGTSDGCEEVVSRKYDFRPRVKTRTNSR